MYLLKRVWERRSNEGRKKMVRERTMYLFEIMDGRLIEFDVERTIHEGVKIFNGSEVMCRFERGGADVVFFGSEVQAES